jgi:dihydroorotate dehydrogenase electron transfer subunit
MEHPETRNTINLEQASVLSHEAFPGNQYVLRLKASSTAAESHPGQFIDIKCDDSLPLRRPMSIMRTDPEAGWLDILYKVEGIGTQLLSDKKTGDALSMLGPIGKPFKLEGYKKFPILIGGGVGLPPMIYLAEHMKKFHKACNPLVIAGSEIPFPFQLIPSKILIDGMPEGIIATMPLLEDWGIPCRLTSQQGYTGCFQGYVTDLARLWLSGLGKDTLAEIEIFSCGPTPMLRAVAKLAHEFNLPCQVSLEEFMACAVGGCAGCTVEVHTESGRTMQRVCVDGPVFEASCVFPQTN